MLFNLDITNIRINTHINTYHLRSSPFVTFTIRSTSEISSLLTVIVGKYDHATLSRDPKLS